MLVSCPIFFPYDSRVTQPSFWVDIFLDAPAAMSSIGGELDQLSTRHI